MMYVLPPHLISLSLRPRLLELRSPISTCLLANPWVIRPPRTSLPLACSTAASLSSRSKTRTRPCRASITMARRLPASGHSGPYSSAAPQFMLVERSSSSTGSFLRLAETAGWISLRGVRLGPPVSALGSFTIGPLPGVDIHFYTRCAPHCRSSRPGDGLLDGGLHLGGPFHM